MTETLKKTRMTRALLVSVALVTALAIAGCGDDDESSDTSGQAPVETGSDQPAPAGDAVEEASVEIAGFDYAPKTVTVKVGGSVEWTNSDGAPHTSTAEDQSFDTGTLNKGDSKSVTFDKAGSFAYICTFHPFMTATVEVVE